MEITVTNAPDADPMPGSLVSVQATHAGREAEQIFDSAKDMNGAPNGQILPGKSVTYSVAFAVSKDPGELQLDVRPGFTGDPAIFTGNV